MNIIADSNAHILCFTPQTVLPIVTAFWPSTV